jgi:hypothetical protein
MVLPGWVSKDGVPIFGAAPACRNLWPDKQVPHKAQTAERVVLVDFDAVLFRTPQRPRWWPFASYETMVQSLLPPCVPRTVTDEYFNEEVIQAITEQTAPLPGAPAPPPTWSVLHTFRTDAFRPRIRDLLAQSRIPHAFDAMRLRPVCRCCSPLGLTHTGAAGYGRLGDLLVAEPERAEDRHLLVILGDVLNDSKPVIELVLYLSALRTRAQCGATGTQLRGAPSSQYERICCLLDLQPHNPGVRENAGVGEGVATTITHIASSNEWPSGFKIVIYGVDAVPLQAGIPDEEEFKMMHYWALSAKSAAAKSGRTAKTARRQHSGGGNGGGSTTTRPRFWMHEDAGIERYISAHPASRSVSLRVCVFASICVCICVCVVCVCVCVCVRARASIY